MKKTFLTIAVLAIVVVALGAAGVAYAQSTTPAASDSESGYCPGMGNGRGHRGGRDADDVAPGEGLLHDAMLAAFAQKLDIPVADLEARLDNGETMVEVALSTGLTLEQFQTLKEEVRLQAIDQALIDGKLTPEQAERMKQRGCGQMAGGQMAGGQMGNGRGMHGNRQGQYVNPDCPYDNDTSTTP